MVNLHEFKEQALSDESQFEIRIRDSRRFFVKYKIGKATYIFGDYSYKRGMMLDSKLSLKAIVSDANIYIVDTFIFDTENEADYPVGVFKFSDKINAINNAIRNVLFPVYYDSLPIRELTEIEREIVMNEVREIIICEGGIVTDFNLGNVMEKEDVAKVLCGHLEINSYANEYFEKKKEDYVRIKSLNYFLRKLVKANYRIEDWEIAMSNAIRDLDAKTFNVEFSFKGKTGTEKVAKDTLLRILRNNDYFSDYKFVNGKSGKRLLEELGAGTYLHHKDGVLRCENIESIRYGKKVIYSKQAVLQKNA